MKTKKPDLVNDQRGAVMVTGLGMACFLIGALWFIVGIGDSVVFKHRMQEAADHTALTSAMIHARGMNFISVCNIVLLVLVAVHLILGIIHDVALAACAATIILCPLWVAARNTWTTYNSFMKPAARAIHGVELVSAYTYPYAGMTRGYQVGRKYGDAKHSVNVLALGSSQIPHAIMDVTGGSVFGGGAPKGAKLGLPLEAEKMNFLCDKLGKDILNWVLSYAGLGSLSKYVKRIGNAVGTAVKARYCNDLGTGGEDKQNDQNEKQNKGNKAIKIFNKLRGKTNLSAISGIDPGFDKFWGESGPLIVYKAASNGSPWMQIWGINLAPQLDDVSERKVGVAPRLFDKIAPLVPVKAPIYFAQAEFFFDCTEKWSDGECNETENAMWAVKWRARMTRAGAPEFARMLGGMGVDQIFRSSMFKDAIKAFKTTKAGKIITDNGLDKVFQSEVRSAIEKLGIKAGDATGANYTTIYH